MLLAACAVFVLVGSRTAYAQETELTDSIETVNAAVQEVNAEREKVISAIKDAIKQDIDSAVIEIRKATSKPAYELQRSIDAERTALFEGVTDALERIRPIDSDRVGDVQDMVGASLKRMEAALEEESGEAADFQKSERDVRDALTRFAELLARSKETIDAKQGELIYADADQDGLSDYVEKYVYRTDPAKAATRGTGKTDGQKVAEGLNPLEEGEARIGYQDPRQDIESHVSSTYRVDKVQLVQENGAERLVFEGSALPSSYVTLFIYSTPIVVTVRTDDSGAWTYEMTQELENGEHQMYVATVDGSGRILARSNPILFTKSAEAATIGIAGSLDTAGNAQNFLKDNFILITLAVLIAIVILTMMFVGNHRNLRSAVADLRKEVTPK